MKEKTLFICGECGHKEYKWTGHCPECGAWNSYSECQKETKGSPKRKEGSSSPLPLSSFDSKGCTRIFSGIDEIDRVMGGGIMRGSSVMIGGEPGIGKSTLLLQTGSMLAEKYKVLYVSGEESAVQIKQRADRIGIKESSMELFCGTELDTILRILDEGKYDFAVIDSIQTVFSSEIGNVPGTATQLKYCCGMLTEWAKQNGATVIMIAHITKEGIIAGPKTAEHMVDTVLYFENSGTELRIVRASKNRYGSIDEFGLFQMGPKGLIQIKNPETVFLIKRGEEIPPGISVAPIFEGTRVFLVEIQALTVPAKAGITRVFSEKTESSVISRIAAVLEKHCGLKFSDQDIYVNIAGGIKIREVGSELPIALALYSARTGIPIPGYLISAGELSLTGEVLKIGNIQGRIKTAEELGFGKFIVPFGTEKDKKRDSIRIAEIRTINEGIKAVFGENSI